MEDSKYHKEYIARISSVQDYIEANLDRRLTLEELADVAGFSKYHFHRIFTGMVHETLFQYINRIRIERAASFLRHSPKLNITDIAHLFGFSDSATFARSFKQYYGVSASEYRLQYSNDCKADGNIRKAFDGSAGYPTDTTNAVEGDDAMKVMGNVEVKMIEDMHVIYMRHTGAYQGISPVFQELIHKLVGWAAARDLLKPGETKLLTVYHDNPEITPEEKQRTSVCLTVPEDTRVSGEISKMLIPSGKYAIGHFEIDAEEYGDAWNYLYGEWLTNSGFQPDDGVSFEVYNNDPKTHPQGKHQVDIYLPVKPL